MSGNKQRNNTSIDNPQVIGAVNLELRINNTTVSLGKHRAGADGVEDAKGGAERKSLPLLIGAINDIEAGLVLVIPKGSHGLSSGSATAVLDGLDDGLEIVGVVEEVGIDDGVSSGAGVGGVDVDAAAGEGVHEARDKGEELLAEEGRGGGGVSLDAGVAVGEDELELRDGGVGEEINLLLRDGVRVSSSGSLSAGTDIGAVVSEDLVPVHKGIAGTGVHVVGALTGEPQRKVLSGVGRVSAEVIKGDISRLELVRGLNAQVILEVLADTGEVNELLNLGCLENLGGTDTREFEENGRLDGAGREDDLLVGADDGAVEERDARGALLLSGLGEVDLGDGGVGDDVEVGPRDGQVGVGRVRPVPGDGVDAARLEHDAEGIATQRLEVGRHAHVIESRDERLLLHGHESVHNGLHGPAVSHALTTIRLRVLSRKRLRLLHRLNHRVPVPPGISQLLPRVILSGSGAVVRHQVESRRPAENATAVVAEHAVVDGGLGHGGEVPVVHGAEGGATHAGDVDAELIGGGGAGLEEEDARIGEA